MGMSTQMQWGQSWWKPAMVLTQGLAVQPCLTPPLGLGLHLKWQVLDEHSLASSAFIFSLSYGSTPALVTSAEQPLFCPGTGCGHVGHTAPVLGWPLSGCLLVAWPILAAVSHYPLPANTFFILSFSSLSRASNSLQLKKWSKKWWAMAPLSFEFQTLLLPRLSPSHQEQQCLLGCTPLFILCCADMVISVKHGLAHGILLNKSLSDFWDLQKGGSPPCCAAASCLH